MMDKNQAIEMIDYFLQDNVIFNDFMCKLERLDKETLIQIKAFRREIEIMTLANDKNVESCISKITKLDKLYNKVDTLLYKLNIDN